MTSRHPCDPGRINLPSSDGDGNLDGHLVEPLHWVPIPRAEVPPMTGASAALDVPQLQVAHTARRIKSTAYHHLVLRAWTGGAKIQDADASKGPTEPRAHCSREDFISAPARYFSAITFQSQQGALGSLGGARFQSRAQRETGWKFGNCKQLSGTERTVWMTLLRSQQLQIEK
jgi:hypothetical protein